MIRKCSKRIVSILLVVIMLMGIFSTLSKAAPASDIPKDMLENVYLDALAYTGYKVQTQKDDGSIFIKFGSRAPESVRSNITYGTGPSGLETISKSGTATGLAPNIATYEANGLCCASYVSYVYYNYLPNIAGIDTSMNPRPNNPRLAAAYDEAANSWIAAGKARRIAFTQSSDGSTFTPAESIPIGSLIVYHEMGGTRVSHVAIYAGYYNGNHFVTHVGNSRGPEFSTVTNSSKGSSPNVVKQVVVPNFVEDNGSIEVYKKDTDGKNLAGAVFVATSTVDSSKQYIIGPTNASGYAYVERVPYGDYIVRETVFPTNYRSYGQTEWRVTVSASNDGKVTINAVNEIIPGSCEIVKTSEDGKVDGISFRIKGTNVDQTVQTANGGKIKVDNLKPGKYSVTELTPEEYVPQVTQTVTIESGKTATVNFNNILKKWRLNVLKVDAELSQPLQPSLLLDSEEIASQSEEPYGQAQGDASLAGAVYGVFEGETLVDTYTTDKNGYFQTDYYICGENWTLREITPSEGYLLDSEIYYISANAENFSIELNDIYMNVYEKIIKGNIAVIKHTDDGSTQIETPEVGAEFKVYLKAAGSYEKAKETERDSITCDETGLAMTKDLPYGVYTVEQTKGWEGKELLPPFDVFISQNEKVYSYIINNAMFDSYIKVVKTDAETGKTIPYAGAGFQIYRPDGSRVEMTYTYPEVTTIDTFYTTNNGSLVTPEMLDYGLGYMLVEVSAPYGYVLDSAPIYFDITEDVATKEEGITLVKVERPNMPQKGIITITKEGEVFSSVVAHNSTYKPVYEVKGLKGAIFEVFAAEDIYTPDGTLRCKQGEVVDRIETKADGTATTKPLYLGKYVVKEVQAPENMVLNGEDVSVELVYAGQEVAITSATTTMYNERQKVQISLEKVLEQDAIFDIGKQDEILSVQFGLYAAEELVAEDGTVIPKGGLIEIASCDYEGKLTFQTDVPVGAKLYVQEVAKDEHYQVSDIKYHIQFDYAGQEVSIVHIFVNDGEKIENKLIRGNISGKKVDEDGNVVEGALFGLFKPDETELSEETALLNCESNKDGLFEFTDVPYGTWIVRELKTLPQYILDETSYEVTIGTHEEIIEITIENKFVTGTLEITKSDLSTGKLLPNVGFCIRNEAGEIVEEGFTDEKGVARFTLRYGKYTYQEFQALDGYLLDEKEYEFEITEDGQIIKAEMKNELIPVSPQTGDQSNLGFWIGLLAIALGGLISVGIVYIKKQKEEDKA